MQNPRLLSQMIEISGQQIQGPLKYNNVSEVLTGVVNGFIFPIAGIIMFVMFVIAGFQLVTSGGDAKKVGAAKSRITASIIGFVLLFSAYFVSRLIGYILKAPTGIL